MRRTLAILFLLAVGCRSRAPETGCPSEAHLEELHAAAFHFEHGSATEAREHLARAKATAGVAPDVTSAGVLAGLERVDREIDSAPEQARAETEWIRLELSEWACLSEASHDRFHERLPPLP